MMQTEYPFTLPVGYVDEAGTLHREGQMRLATAADEILPLEDPRVQANPSYLVIVLLARVVTTLGSLPHVTPTVVEGLYAADLACLRELFNRINHRGKTAVGAVCPKCAHAFDVEVERPGGHLRSGTLALSEA